MRTITLTNEVREALGILAWAEVDVFGGECGYTGYVQQPGCVAEYVGGSKYYPQIEAAVNARCTELVAELSAQAEGFNVAPDSTPVDAEQEGEQACATCDGEGRIIRASSVYGVEVYRREIDCPDCLETVTCTCGGIDCTECSKPMAYAPVQVGDQGAAVAKGLWAMAEIAVQPVIKELEALGYEVEVISEWPPVPTPAPSFREKAQAAIEAAREACLDKARWLVAVEKAAEELERGNWIYQDGVLKIQSRTQTGTIYRVIKGRCSCEAGHRGIACWHRAAWKILKNTSA